MIDDLLAENDMVAVGTVPIHPGVLDYEDSGGKIILFVRDYDEGRSLFLGVEMYGDMARLYEVRYDDWADVITKMAGDVILADADDPYNRLLMGDAV
jgi:hypothetical protein